MEPLGNHDVGGGVQQTHDGSLGQHGSGQQDQDGFPRQHGNGQLNHQYFHFSNVTSSNTFSSPSVDCNSCIIEAPGGVSLIYWGPEDVNNTAPVNQTSPSDEQEPYTLVEDGFTFTSPSVYVVYTSLQATYGCGTSAITTLGSAFPRKTIEYSSRFLAYGTLESPGQRCDANVVVDGFHTIDFKDLYYSPIITSTTTKAGCPPYVNPRLSMPAELTDVDPAWATCQPLYYGAFDPPRALHKANGGLGPAAQPAPKPAPAPQPAHVPVITSTHEVIPVAATEAPSPPAIAAPTSAPASQDTPLAQGPPQDSPSPQDPPAPQGPPTPQDPPASQDPPAPQDPPVNQDPPVHQDPPVPQNPPVDPGKSTPPGAPQPPNPGSGEQTPSTPPNNGPATGPRPPENAPVSPPAPDQDKPGSSDDLPGQTPPIQGNHPNEPLSPEPKPAAPPQNQPPPPHEPSAQAPSPGTPSQSQPPANDGAPGDGAPGNGDPGDATNDTGPDPQAPAGNSDPPTSPGHGGTSSPGIIPVINLPDIPHQKTPGPGPVVILPGLIPPEAPTKHGDSPSPVHVDSNGEGVTTNGAKPQNPIAPNVPIVVALPASPHPSINPPPKQESSPAPGSTPGMAPESSPKLSPSSSPDQIDVGQGTEGSQPHPASGESPTGLANPIVFGLSGPKPGTSLPNVVGDAPSAEGTPQDLPIVSGDGAGAPVQDVHLGFLQTPTLLAVKGHSIEVASDGGVVVAGQSIAPGQQVTIDESPISVGSSNLVIDGSTHPFVPPTQAPSATTIYSESMQELTLAAGASATIGGKVVTNTGVIPSLYTQAANVAINTIPAIPGAADGVHSIPRIILSASVEAQTIAPGELATFDGTTTTNTASTAIVLSQTRSVPIVTTYLPAVATPILSTIYSSSQALQIVVPGSIYTVSGTVSTNTASTSVVVSSQTLVPIATTTISPSIGSMHDEPAQIYEVNGQLVTDTAGVYGVSEMPLITGGGSHGGEKITIGLVNPKNGQTTRTTVLTVPSSWAEQLGSMPTHGAGGSVSGGRVSGTGRHGNVTASSTGGWRSSTATNAPSVFSATPLDSGTTSTTGSLGLGNTLLCLGFVSLLFCIF